MPEKYDPDTSPSVRLLRIFRKLALNDRKYYLADLAAEFNCSSQTIIRIMGDIESVIGTGLQTGLDNRRRWYRICGETVLTSKVLASAACHFAMPPLGVFKTRAAPGSGKDSLRESLEKALLDGVAMELRYKNKAGEMSFQFAPHRILGLQGEFHVLGVVLDGESQPKAPAMLGLDRIIHVKRLDHSPIIDYEAIARESATPPWPDGADELFAELP